MKHQTNARTFGRSPAARKALLRGLSDQLIEHGRISTTLIRAKELKKMVEPLVTLAKKGDLHARRQAAGLLYKKETLQKLFDVYGPQFKSRAGGYTRIIRNGFRHGDAAPSVFVEFVSGNETKAGKKSTAKKKTTAPKVKKTKAEAPASEVAAA